MSCKRLTRRSFLNGISALTAGAVCDLQTIAAAAPLLSSDHLRVDFYPDFPIVQSYLHKPTGLKFGGGNRAGTLALNNDSIPWSKWQIAVDTALLPEEVRYNLKLDAPQVEIRIDYRLEGYVLEMEVQVLGDPREWLRTIEWQDLPVLTCTDQGITIWRQEWKEKSWDAKIGRGLWFSHLTEKPVSQFGLDSEPLATTYSCFYRPDKVCAAVATNYPYLPIRNQITENSDATKSYSLGLNTYQYRVRGEPWSRSGRRLRFCPT